MRKPLPSRILVLLGCAFALALLAGCSETKQEFTLNPDGSGKVVHECTFQSVDMNFSSRGKQDAESQMKAAVAAMMSKAKGVDAWSDVSYKLLDDGRIYFKGTAYFHNLSELDIPNQMMMEFAWTRSDDGSGKLTLREKDGKKASKAAKAEGVATPEKIKEARAKYQQAKPMMTMFLGSLKHDVVFHLPGKPGKATAFQRDPSGALQLHFEGAKMMAAMDTLFNDDKWIAQHSDAMDPDSPPPIDDEMNLLLFGDKGPVQATVSGLGSPAFDYEAEVTAAREASATLQQQLGVAPAAIAPAAQSGELKSLRVVGVRLVQPTDEKLNLQPFNSQPGFALALLAELPGSALAMTDECGIDTAIADDDSNLLPEQEWDRRISFPHLAEDKVHVLFEVQMTALGANVKGLKEVSGHLQFTTSSTTQEVALGFAKLTAGADGKELSAHIESIEAEGDKPGAQRMELKLDCKPDGLKAVYLVQGKTKTELHRSGYNGYNDSYTYTFDSETGFPTSAKLVAEIYAELQTFNSVFKLENITLLGEPAN